MHTLINLKKTQKKFMYFAISTLFEKLAFTPEYVKKTKLIQSVHLLIVMIITAIHLLSLEKRIL